MGVSFQENAANTKIANTKSNNGLKSGVPIQFFADICKKTYTQTDILNYKIKNLMKNINIKIGFRNSDLFGKSPYLALILDHFVQLFNNLNF